MRPAIGIRHSPLRGTSLPRVLRTYISIVKLLSRVYSLMFALDVYNDRCGVV